MITKNLFVRGTTDHEGRINFTVESDYADIANGNWRVKAETVIFQLQERDFQTVGRPVSCSVNFCYPPQHGDRDQRRQPLKLAFGIIEGFWGDFISLTTRGGDFISFRNPSGNLYLTLLDEARNKPLKNTPVIANFIISKDL